MMEFLKSEKFWKLVRYVLVGAVTTLTNYLMLWVLFYRIHMNYDVANAIAIATSIAVAYVLNKLFVFRSHVDSFGALVRETVAFVASRAITGILEWGSAYLIHNVFGMDEEQWGMVTKIGTNVVVIILNYVFAQLFVFKGEKKK